MNYERSEVEALVRRVITRTLGLSGERTEVNMVGRRAVVDAESVRQMPSGSVQKIAANALITPLARQAAMERRIRLECMDGEPTELISDVQVAGGTVHARKTVKAYGGTWRGSWRIRNEGGVEGDVGNARVWLFRV